MTLTPDYDELASALQTAGVEMSAAEAHGLITGSACFPDPPTLARVLLGSVPNPLPPPVEELLTLAQDLQDDVRRRLEETDFEFEPLLGEADMSEQVARLGSWARGFLLGLAAGGLRDAKQLRGEAGEFLLDAVEIGEAEMDEDQDTERQERDLAEVVEYLRVGVQLVYDELRTGG